MVKLETTILSNLVNNEEYCRKVVPFIKPEYFESHIERVVVTEQLKFFNEYNKPPSLNILAIELANVLKNHEVDEAENLLNELTFATENNDWLISQTEAFCKKRAMYNAIIDAFNIIDGKDKETSEGAIPEMLSNALAVSFDKSVGHDYIEDAEARYDFYHRIEEKIPFDLDIFNKITRGGLSKKTLNIALAGTGVGKSLFMCHCAAACLMQNYNVVYITLEMSEEKIAERIDLNLLNMTMPELKEATLDLYKSRIGRLHKKSTGKLIIKEYPTSSAHAGHFKILLNELEIKKDFKPDIIFVDYLNICASSRIKGNAAANSYTLIKSIAEELRGLAQEYNVPIVSATQTNREGLNNSDIDLTNTSESIGLPQTADMMFALISTEQLESLNQLMVKQLKNRYESKDYYGKFIIGIDRSKMRLYNAEDSAQEDLANNGQSDDKEDDLTPLFDKSSFGNRMRKEKNLKGLS